MKFKIVVFIIFISLNCFAQEDSIAIFKERYPEELTYVFKKGSTLISPSIGFAKGTKNNFGAELEYGVTSQIGFVGSIGTSSFDDKTAQFLNSIGINKTRFTGVTIGLRSHNSFKKKSQQFDLLPGVYWSKLFDPDKTLDFTSSFALGVDARYFFNTKTAINFGVYKTLKTGTDLGFSLGLVFDLGEMKEN
jgi:hypothetical protein